MVSVVQRVDSVYDGFAPLVLAGDDNTFAGFARWSELLAAADRSKEGGALVEHVAADGQCPCALPSCAGNLPGKATRFAVVSQGIISFAGGMNWVFLCYTAIVTFGPSLWTSAWAVAGAAYCAMVVLFYPLFTMQAQPVLLALERGPAKGIPLGLAVGFKSLFTKPFAGALDCVYQLAKGCKHDMRYLFAPASERRRRAAAKVPGGVGDAAGEDGAGLTPEEEETVVRRFLEFRDSDTWTVGEVIRAEAQEEAEETAGFEAGREAGRAARSLVWDAKLAQKQFKNAA